MKILGISCFYHDSSAVLVENGKVTYAVQEERFTRIKHDSSFPLLSITFILEKLGISLSELDAVVFYENPVAKLDRVLHNALSYASDWNEYLEESVSSLFRSKFGVLSLLRDNFGRVGKNDILHTKNHHISHLSSAFYPSPFQESAILSVDGVGEWNTTSLAHGSGNKIEVKNVINYPHSLGLLYSAFTAYCGFKVNSGEYKLMGLAPYGKPEFETRIFDNLVNINEDGSFSLNMDFFNYGFSDNIISEKFNDLFGGPPRISEEKITTRIANIASSIQGVTEKILFSLLNSLHKATGSSNITLSGGVALNCVANGKIVSSTPFKNIWIQPASGDAGTALGAALHFYYDETKNKRQLSKTFNTLLGPRYTNTEIEKVFKDNGATYEFVNSEDMLSEKIAQLLSEGNVIGHFAGNMEFGPRALGSRSILGDPRDPEMQMKMNLKIKYRESFRPFAPAVLEDHCATLFDLDDKSPYMLIVSKVRGENLIPHEDDFDNPDLLERVKVARSTIPAVTHVDNSARIQTVGPDHYARFHKIINAFYEKTSCPAVINTSFNVRGEPIVCTPLEALTCFMRTEMDVLVVENFILLKNNQVFEFEDDDWRSEFELD